ncbi:MAG: DNA primase [Candidatus Cloacimonetes bacterium]|nr:DNA primase [Candidatus Cloacimonadota bacterium]
MKKTYFILLLFSITLLIAVEPHFMTSPAISPDGEKICFVYKNDLFLVPFSGGEVKRITATSASEWSPKFSPDGKKIAFNSNRNGWSGLYIYDFENAMIKTINQEEMNILDWFPDNKRILARGYQPGKGNIFYIVNLDGSFKLLTAFAGRNASVSGDGNKIIFDRRGEVYRESYTGSYNGELWQYDLIEHKFTRFTNTDFTEQYPVYSSISDEVYFACSDGNVFQLNKVENNNFERPIQLSKFKTWSARELSIAKSNNRLVFELFDKLWRFDPKTEKVSEIKIEFDQDCYVNPVKRENVKNSASNFTVSDDGQLVVFAYKFDLFAVPEKGGDVVQITKDQRGIDKVEILADNQTVIFTKRVEGELRLYKFNIKDIAKIEEIKWSESKYVNWLKRQKNTIVIGYSDNEKKHKVALADSMCNNIQTIINDQYVFGNVKISPDEKYLLYEATRPEMWTNHVYLYNIELATKELLYNHEGWLDNIFWGKDHKSVFFTEDGNIRRVDLQAREDFYKEKNHWKEILDPTLPKQEKTKSQEVDKTPIIIDSEGFSKRISTIISKPGNNWVVQVEDDSTLYYLNNFEKKYSLRKSDYSGENDKLITLYKNRPENLQFNEENKVFYYILEKKLYKQAAKKSKKAEIINMDYKYTYDNHKLNSDIFHQVWVEFGNGFYDPDMHGINWRKSRDKFSKYLQFADDTAILKKIVDEMIGEVNASHTGFYPRDESDFVTYHTAYCGIELDWEYFPKHGLTITKVYMKSKLNKPHNIKIGDILLTVDGNEVGKGMDFVPLFKDKIGEKVKLGIRSGKEMKVVTVKGLTFRENINLYYDNWVEERRLQVDDLSNGKIGYLHIRSMNHTSYRRFIQDLFAENADKEALIIDVRNNGGGYIHDMLVEILTKKPYALSTYRSFDGNMKYANPGNTVDVPMVLLINENSFSDAEIFPTLFKQFKLGKVIGMPTSGSVIGTGHHTFMDGSSMRMPSTGWFTPNGENMEGNGVQPDIYIDPTPEQIINDDDVQLKKAIEELLKDI